MRPPGALATVHQLPCGATGTLNRDDVREERDCQWRERPRVFEIASFGPDENLQEIGADPFGSIVRLGLRVPTLATALAPPGGGIAAGGPSPFDSRYLFLLGAKQVPEGGRCRVVSFGQFASIGQAYNVGGATRVNELQITTPSWHFIDGDISWHLMWIPGTSRNMKGLQEAVRGTATVEGCAYLWSDTPALLYGNGTTQAAGPPGLFYVNLTAYVPPNKGRPWGEPASPALGTFVDLRSGWAGTSSLELLEAPFEGRGTLAFFASVRQTNPSGRVALAAPADPGSLGPEERFLQANSNAIYWAVGGRLVLEETYR